MHLATAVSEPCDMPPSLTASTPLCYALNTFLTSICYRNAKWHRR